MPDTQYLFQDENGERAPYVKVDGQKVPLNWVTFPAFLQAFKGKVVEIQGPAKHIRVVALKEHKYAKPARPLQYGGSKAERDPFNFGKEFAKAGQKARVHQLHLN